MASVESSLELRVGLRFRCHNLPRADLLSKSDPYLELFLFDRRTNAWNVVGKTETIQNDHNPQFITELEVPYRFEEEQNLLIRVTDDDFGQKRDDFLGEARLKLGQVMGARGQTMKIKLIGKNGKETRGSVTIRAEQSSSVNRGILHLKLAGRNLDRKDGWFGKSDPFFIIARSRSGKEEDFENVFKSEYIAQTLNPTWQEASIPLSRLEGGTLRLEVSDRDPNKTDLIGYASISVQDLVQMRKNIPLIHPPTKSKYTKSSYVNSGVVDVISARVEERYNMIDYLRGGLQIQLIIAVDFTGSNGDPNQPGTLHYGSGMRNNPYTDAIAGVGNILMDYDSDKLVPAFGFGARPTPGAPVSHLFALNGHNQQPDCFNISGVLDAYRSVFQRGAVLSGPTNFSQVIRFAGQQAADASREGPMLAYSVLLLLTDGAISDMDATIDAICEAAHQPLSIIIVGVGSADFSSMEALDADIRPLVDSRGVRCPRDIVQFVPFNKVSNNAALLAKETLAEMPDQISQYFGSRRIPPGRPVMVSDMSAQSLHGGEQEIPTGVPFMGGGVAVPPPPIDPSAGKRLFSSAYTGVGYDGASVKF